MKDLSILIPARNEKYLFQTIEDIKKHIEADTEILWEEDVEPIGQRALTNRLAERAQGKYVMKVDAHCLFSQGFDRVMLEDMDDKTIMSPFLLGLDVENWKPIPKPTSSAYCFGTDMIFRYHLENENKDPINETMCLQGSAWMIDRDTYFKWNVSDEKMGSWGQQGVELGCKAWFNGGRCVTTKKAYYAHWFRKPEGFPYPLDHKQVDNAISISKDFLKHPKMPWLVKKFGYPADWTEEEVKRLCTSG